MQCWIVISWKWTPCFYRVSGRENFTWPIMVNSIFTVNFYQYQESQQLLLFDILVECCEVTCLRVVPNIPTFTFCMHVMSQIWVNSLKEGPLQALVRPDMVNGTSEICVELSIRLPYVSTASHLFSDSNTRVMFSQTRFELIAYCFFRIQIGEMGGDALTRQSRWAWLVYRCERAVLNWLSPSLPFVS